MTHDGLIKRRSCALCFEVPDVYGLELTKLRRITLEKYCIWQCYGWGMSSSMHALLEKIFGVADGP